MATRALREKPTVIAIGLPYFVGVAGSAIATSVYKFVYARLIDGLGIGLSTVAAPLHIRLTATQIPWTSRGSVLVRRCCLLVLLPISVAWVLISEVFHNTHPMEGQVLGSLTHWIFAAPIATIVPRVVSVFEPGYVVLFLAD